MSEPIFIKSDKYYFDVDKNTIYGKEYKSRQYYHELSHFQDMSKKWYKKLNYLFDVYVQIFAFIYLIGFLTLFFSYIFYLQITFMFLPYAVFRVQEELRAEIYAYNMTK